MDLCSLLDCVFNLVRGACILYSIRRAHCVVTLRNWRCRLQNPSSSLQGNFSRFSEMWEVRRQTSNDRREIWGASVFRNATSLCTSSSAKFWAQAAQTPYLLLGRGQELTNTNSYLTFKVVGPACQNIAGNYHVGWQKKIAFSYSDPGGTLEKIKQPKTLIWPQQRAISLHQGANPGDQKQNPQKLNTRVMTSQSETSGRNHIC